MSAGLSLRADVHAPGEPVRRDVEVRMDGGALTVGERTLSLDDLLWVDRRQGLYLLFTPESSVALQAADDALDELAAAVAGRIPEEERRRRLQRLLGGKQPRLAVGCAVVGRVSGRAVHGLRVAVVTADGLQLLGSGDVLRMRWPADAAERVEGRGERRALRIRRGEDVVALHFLREDEEESVRRVASRGEAAGGSGSLEMFRQKEVAPPPAAEVPELSVAAEALHSTAAEAADGVPTDLREEAGLRSHFLETHFLELGEIALGPLLMRKSAASGARSLERAVEALDAGELQDDTRTAVSRAVGRLTEVYEEELERLRAERKAPRRIREERELGRDELDRLTARVQAPFDQLAPHFRELQRKQERLATRLEEVAEGPPGDEDRGVERLADGWRSELRRLDRGFRDAWTEALEQFRLAWESILLPRLVEVAEVSHRRVPEWAQLVLLGILTFLVVGAVVLLLGG